MAYENKNKILKILTKIFGKCLNYINFIQKKNKYTANLNKHKIYHIFNKLLNFI